MKRRPQCGNYHMYYLLQLKFRQVMTTWWQSGCHSTAQRRKLWQLLKGGVVLSTLQIKIIIIIRRKLAADHCILYTPVPDQLLFGPTHHYHHFFAAHELKWFMMWSILSKGKKPGFFKYIFFFPSSRKKTKRSSSKTPPTSWDVQIRKCLQKVVSSTRHYHLVVYWKMMAAVHINNAWPSISMRSQMKTSTLDPRRSSKTQKVFQFKMAAATLAALLLINGPKHDTTLQAFTIEKLRWTTWFCWLTDWREKSRFFYDVDSQRKVFIVVVASPSSKWMVMLRPDSRSTNQINGLLLYNRDDILAQLLINWYQLIPSDSAIAHS